MSKYELWDENEGQYRCPFCDSRILRVGTYAECTDCGEQFRKTNSTEHTEIDNE